MGISPFVRTWSFVGSSADTVIDAVNTCLGGGTVVEALGICFIVLTSWLGGCQLEY